MMLSDNIKTIRRDRGFTQEELAARLHITRQTVSKWEKGYSVPDADLLSRMAEVFEVSVEELLGAPSPERKTDMDPVVEQLSRLNEQLAIRNRRTARTWKIVAIVLAVLILVPLLFTVLGVTLYSARPMEKAGSVEWQCALDGETYICGVTYTKDYRIIAGSADASTELADRVAAAGVEPSDQGDALRAQTVLYEWFKAQGGTVEVLRQEGLALPEMGLSDADRGRG